MIYRTLTDAELLRRLDDRIARSPIMQELASRLDKKIAPKEPPHSPGALQCPCCEARLRQSEFSEDLIYDQP